MALVVIPRYFNPTLTITMLGVIVRFANGAGLQTSFRIERSIEHTPDSCQISISGLDPVRALGMGVAFQTLGASAISIVGGYDVVSTGMFTGDVREFRSARRDGADVWTDIAANDSGDAYSDVALPAELRSNVGLTAQNMIDIGAALLGCVLAPSVAEVLSRSDYTKQGPYTCVMVGKAHELIDAACRRIKARWWIRDKQIHLASLGLPTAAVKAVLVTPGMVIGDVAIGGSGVLSLPMMFDPNVVPGGQVSYLGTLFRVDRVVHSGLTRGGLWSSMTEGRAL